MNTKLHAVTDARGRPISFLMTAGQVSDYTGAAALLDGLPKADWLLGDRGYDADWFRDALEEKGITPCIPGRKSRNKPVRYDKPIQKPQQDRDHVRSSQRLEARRNTLRQVPDRLPICRRARRHRPVLDMSPDPRSNTISAPLRQPETNLH